MARGPRASEAPALLEALLEGFPVPIIICDRYLAPLHASASAAWLLDEQGAWATTPPAIQVQAAAAAALDSHGQTRLILGAAEQCWEAIAAPLAHATAAVSVTVHPLHPGELLRDRILRQAHDLKAPIHAVKGFTRLLLRESAGPLTGDQRHFLEIASSEADRLTSHLDRLLHTMRFQQNVPERIPTPGKQTHASPATDLNTVVRDTAARLHGAAQAKRLRLHLPSEEPLLVTMSDGELTTVVENLLANAIAATPPGGTITIETTQADSCVRCTVRDTGPGIPEESVEQVFEPYFRLPERGARGGTGLGLAISRGLVVAHGGQLVAANLPAGGAAFTVELPVAVADARCWPHLHAAPVMSHAALAAVRAALSRHVAEPWRILTWHDGLLTVEIEATRAAAYQASIAIARATTFACWLGTS